MLEVAGKAIPAQDTKAQRADAPRMSIQSTYEGGKAVSPTHRPSLPTGKNPGTYFCPRSSRPQRHSAAGRIKSMINSKRLSNYTHIVITQSFSSIKKNLKSL